MKKYRKLNKERLRLWSRNYAQSKIGRKAQAKYRKDHKEALREKARKFRQENKEICLLRSRKNYQLHREKYLIYFKKRRRKNKSLWLSILPKNPKCELCEKPLKYFFQKRIDCVNFDHKKGNLPIKTRPTAWLYRHPPTPKNLKIWNSCNFGILCLQCNTFLPTKNRKNFLKKLFRFIKKELDK